MRGTLARPRVRRTTTKWLVPPRRLSHLGPRGRATLLWGLASFVVLQAGLRIAIDTSLPELRDPTFEIKARQFQQALDLHRNRNPVTVCMFGSSVTGRAFNGKHLETLLTNETARPTVAFNMSDHAAGPLTHLIYLRRLLERKVHLDLVLIEVFPAVINSRHEPADLPHFPAYRLEERDLEIVLRYSGDRGLRNEWRLGRLVPAYFHRFPIMHNLCLPLVSGAEQLPMWREYDDHGWHEVAPLDPEVLGRNLEIVKQTYRDGLKDFRPGTETVRALEESLALLRKERIRAAVVLMPIGQTMRDLTGAAGVAELKETVGRLCLDHRHAFLDAYTWLEEDMFTDSYHANTTGSRIFTERLASELIQPLLATK